MVQTSVFSVAASSDRNSQLHNASSVSPLMPSRPALKQSTPSPKFNLLLRRRLLLRPGRARVLLHQDPVPLDRRRRWVQDLSSVASLRVRSPLLAASVLGRQVALLFRSVKLTQILLKSSFI